MKGAMNMRAIAWLVAIALIALPIVGVLQGWFAASRWPVRQLQVQGEFAHVDAEELKKAVAPSLRAGFFALDLGRVRDAVADLPWVAQVEARKRWPDTLVLVVRERQPIARWGERRLIGRDGVLFTAPGAEAMQGLPQLDGPDDSVGEVVDFYTRTQRALAGSGLVLSGAILSGRGSWKLSLVGGAEIMLGHEQVDARVQRFLDVLPRLSAEHAGGFQRADLRYANGFAIQWAAAAPVPPPSRDNPV